MKRLAASLVFLGWTISAFAVGGGTHLIPIEVDLSDQAALQRGARTFVNYCLSCHSAAYMRYSRMAEDLGISEELTQQNLMFVTENIGNPMKVAMPSEDAVEWFDGVAPPDLSVTARSRGAEWLNTFLLTFYVDPERPTGVNNLAFPDTAMPHVLWQLQGLQRLIEAEPAADPAAGHGAAAPGFERVSEGRLTEKQYRRTVRDLVSFLVYVGEPAKLVRYRVGRYVIAFLIVFTVLSYLVKREYWKDIH